MPCEVERDVSGRSHRRLVARTRSWIADRPIGICMCISKPSFYPPIYFVASLDMAVFCRSTN